MERFPWTKLSRPLTALRAADLNGRVWTDNDFEGKNTLAVVWATWCGPCHAEMPQVEVLFEKLKSRKDVHLVTISTDSLINLIHSLTNSSFSSKIFRI